MLNESLKSHEEEEGLIGEFNVGWEKGEEEDRRVGIYSENDW